MKIDEKCSHTMWKLFRIACCALKHYNLSETTFYIICRFVSLYRSIETKKKQQFLNLVNISMECRLKCFIHLNKETFFICEKKWNKHICSNEKQKSSSFLRRKQKCCNLKKTVDCLKKKE